MLSIRIELIAILFSWPVILFCLPKSTYTIRIEPTWQCLDYNSHKAAHLGGSYIHAGTITLKKKTKSYAYLEALTLEWHGTNIEHLTASLYKKEPGRPLLALEQNCLGDSTWLKEQQKLILRLEKTLRLEGINQYYLVFTVPTALENTLKNGFFTIVPRCSDSVFQKTFAQNPIKLAFAQ